MTLPLLTTRRELSSLNTTGGTNALALPDADVSRPRTRAAGLCSCDTLARGASGPSKRGDLSQPANRTCPVATPYPLRTSPVPATSLLMSAARSTLDDRCGRVSPKTLVIEPFNRGRTSRGVLPVIALSAPRITVANLEDAVYLSVDVSDPHKDGDRLARVYLKRLVPIPHHASDQRGAVTHKPIVARPFTIADLGLLATRRTTVGNPSFAGDRIRTAALLSDVPGTTNPASDQEMIGTRCRNVACPF